MRSFLTYLGVVFAVIGGFTAFDIAINVALAHRVDMMTLGYAGLDLMIAYAFINKQRWLTWALAANWVSFVAIVSLTSFHGAYSPSAAVGFVINTAVTFIAFYYRKLLRSRENWYAAGAFAVVWVLTMGYTLFKLLS
jgi:hypothetical protein